MPDREISKIWIKIAIQDHGACGNSYSPGRAVLDRGIQARKMFHHRWQLVEQSLAPRCQRDRMAGSSNEQAFAEGPFKSGNLLAHCGL